MWAKKIKGKIIRSLASTRIRRINRKLHRDIYELLAVNKEIVKLSSRDKHVLEHRDYWKDFPVRFSKEWISYYGSLKGNFNKHYVPENIYYPFIEPVLNNSRFSEAYSDKNFYDLIYPKGVFPDTVLRNIDACWYDGDYRPVDDINGVHELLRQHTDILVKPSVDSGGARNIFLYSRNKADRLLSPSGDELTPDGLEQSHKKNFVLQSLVKQHLCMSKYNLSSVNTLRVMTLRHPADNQIKILHIVMRVGREGGVVDNMRAGGISCGIDLQTGKLNSFALDMYSRKQSHINGISLAEDHYIPFIDRVKEKATHIASRNLYHRFLALDMYIAESGEPKCIEVNNRGNEINFFQTNNGPLFGAYTDDIRDFVLANLGEINRQYVI